MIAVKIRRAVKELRVVPLSGLSVEQAVSDWFHPGCTSAELLALCQAGLRGAGVVCPQDDAARGRNFPRPIAARIRPAVKELRVVRLPGLSEKQDVSDWLDAGHTRDGLLALCQAAEPGMPAWCSAD